MKWPARRFAVSVAVLLSFGVVAASPAAADQPVEETFPLSTAVDFEAYFEGGAAFNACTGEFLPEIVVDSTAANHFGHPNNYVSAQGKRTVNQFDTTGFTLKGTDRVQFNFISGNFSWVVNDTWTSPDGETFKLHMVLKDRGNTSDFPDAYTFSGHCLNGPTVLPAP